MDTAIKRGKYTVLEIPESDLVYFTGPDGGSYTHWKLADDFLLGMSPMRSSGVLPDMRINLPKIKDMTCRSDDIFLCAYAKAGTHWVWEIANMLTTGKLQYLTQIKEEAMMEFHYPEEFDNLASPRILNTHLPFRCLPTDVSDKRLRVIFVQRNPKDVAVSLYNHMAKMSPENQQKTFRDHLSCMNEYQIWFKYTRPWEKAIEDNPDIPIHSVYYESLKKNPEEEITRLSKFLGQDRDEKFIAEVAKMCSFTNMKKANDDSKDISKYQDAFGKLLRGMYRKGEIGDWKNWFTVALNEEFDVLYAELMKDSKFKYEYS